MTKPLVKSPSKRAIAFDHDAHLAGDTRKRLLDLASSERLLIAGMHLDKFGFAQVERINENYCNTYVGFRAKPVLRRCKSLTIKSNKNRKICDGYKSKAGPFSYRGFRHSDGDPVLHCIDAAHVVRSTDRRPFDRQNY